MNLSDIVAESFSYDILDSIRDCFTMPSKDDQEREGYVSHIPKDYPNTLLIPVQEGLDLLKMYTSGMKEFFAPADLCLRKAIEVLDDYDTELALSLFRLDLNSQVTTSSGYDDIDSLIAGLRALIEWLGDYFISYGLYIDHKLVYVYDQLMFPGMMVMSKMSYCDGTSRRTNSQPLHFSHEGTAFTMPVLS